MWRALDESRSSHASATGRFLPTAVASHRPGTMAARAARAPPLAADAVTWRRVRDRLGPLAGRQEEIAERVQMRLPTLPPQHKARKQRSFTFLPVHTSRGQSRAVKIFLSWVCVGTGTFRAR